MTTREFNRACRDLHEIIDDLTNRQQTATPEEYEDLERAVAAQYAELNRVCSFFDHNREI